MLSNVYCNVILGYSDLCWRIENKFLEYSFWLTQLTRRNEQCLGLLRSACWPGGGFRMVCGHPRLCQAWIARLCGSAFSKLPCFCKALHAFEERTRWFVSYSHGTGDVERAGSGQASCKISWVAWWEMLLYASKRISQQNSYKYVKQN